jgi:cell wall-associated NlpC family hydrolase
MPITSQTIVKQARSWLGTRYHHQGRLKRSATSGGGIDCLGLIIGVAKELEIPARGSKLLSNCDESGYSAYPDGARLRWFLDQHLRPVSKKQIRAGDVLLFKIFEHPQHIGIATDYPAGGLGIIHCYSGAGAVVEHILSPSWQRMLVGGYRFQEK